MMSKVLKPPISFSLDQNYSHELVIALSIHYCYKHIVKKSITFIAYVWKFCVDRIFFP